MKRRNDGGPNNEGANLGQPAQGVHSWERGLLHLRLREVSGSIHSMRELENEGEGRGRERLSL